jgi:hypothetical protein
MSASLAQSGKNAKSELGLDQMNWQYQPWRRKLSKHEK